MRSRPFLVDDCAELRILGALLTTRRVNGAAEVLAADVAGYCRLIGADEEGTLAH